MTYSWPYFIFIFSILLSYTVNGQNIIEYPYATPVKLGQGWNTVRQAPAQAVCIDFIKETLPAVDVPYAKLAIASDKNNVQLAISVNNKAEMTLPIASGAASLDFSSKLNTSVDSSLITAEARVELGPEFVSTKDFSKALLKSDSNPGTAIPGSDVLLSPALTGANEVRLREPYRVLLAQSPERFAAVCGDSFVYTLYRGAVMYGLIEVVKTSREEKLNLATSVKGSALKVGDAGGGAFSGSFASDYNNLRQAGRTRSHFVAYGAGDTIPSDDASLINALNTLPSVAKKNPRYLRFGALPYSSLPEWSNRPITTVFESPVSKLTRKWLELDVIRAAIANILASDEYLKSFDTTTVKLQMLDQRVLQDREKIEKRLQQCETGQKGCNLKGLESIDDYEYRAQLPVIGNFNSFGEGADIKGLIERLATARWSTWIEQPHRLRCDLQRTECKSQVELQKKREEILTRLRQSIGL